jgi:hypothetical protein
VLTTEAWADGSLLKGVVDLHVTDSVTQAQRTDVNQEQRRQQFQKLSTVKSQRGGDRVHGLLETHVAMLYNDNPWWA